MVEYGIWSELAGGFIETGFYSKKDGYDAIPRLGLDDDEREEARVLAICAEHPEEPASSCELCALEDAEYYEHDEEEEDDE